MALEKIITLVKQNPAKTIKTVSGIANLGAITGYCVKEYVHSLPLWQRGAASLLDIIGLLDEVLGKKIIGYRLSEVENETYLEILVAGSFVYVATDVLRMVYERSRRM